MSSVIRKFQREKSKKPRLRRKRQKGPSRVPRIVSPPQEAYPIPEGAADMSKANPGCKVCYGTGWGPTLVKKTGKTGLICTCVLRGMAGDAPWLKKGI